jgi:hypothetical protein
MASALVISAILGWPCRAWSQEARQSSGDRFELAARSESYLTLFRRALLPGPSGAIVESETVAPIHEYFSLRASRVDAPWRPDSVSIEVAGWGRALPTDNRYERQLNGDLQTAFVDYHQDHFALRLGRQQVVGGAARFTRFDGAMIAVERLSGVSARAYSGFSVQPRWNDRTTYHHLGSESDSLLRDPHVLDDVPRRRYWVAGASLSYEARRASVMASFHEQREDGKLAHRNLGLDARATLTDYSTLGGSAVLDADATRLADARVWLDLAPVKPLSLSVEYLHTEPALWLSRQSVLSVFSSDRFDEAGGTATLRPLRDLQLEAACFATIYDDGRAGTRSEGTLRFAASRRSQLRLSYARVLALGNGYQSARAAWQQKLMRQLAATLETYFYFYDHAISGYRSSSVYAGTLGYELSHRFSLLWGGSLSRTPYAGLDAQTLVRLTATFDHPGPGGAR